jgi:hypothetical protein
MVGRLAWSQKVLGSIPVFLHMSFLNNIGFYPDDVYVQKVN